ncbi:MAG: hypothetical protein H6822_10525 [Planctomycetaceae bacterium]|nr:hypothetical protein [Planctomycetales bacterium]MCB9922607.1 hypothetical protein [Planctomycetaceae bacterium]
MNANQKLRLPRTVAIVAIAFAGGAWWSSTAQAQLSPGDKLINWNDYPVKNPFGLFVGDNGSGVASGGTCQRQPDQGNDGTPSNNGSNQGGGAGCPIPPDDNGNNQGGGSGYPCPPNGNGGNQGGGGSYPCPPNGNGGNCPNGGGIPPWIDMPNIPPPNCPPGYQGKPPQCTPPGGGTSGGTPPGFGKPPGCTPPNYGKPPGSGKPPGGGKPPGQQQTPKPPKPPGPPPGCQWDKSQGRTPGGGNQSNVVISWVGQVQVDGNTLRVEFKKSGNIWIESWNGVALFQHQEQSFANGVVVLYDAVRQIYVQLDSTTASFSGPTGSGQLSGRFQAIG